MLEGKEGPHDKWRKWEDDMAMQGNTINFERCKELGVSEEWLERWMGGIELDTIEGLETKMLKNYPMDNEKRMAGGAELDRLHGLRKIIWYEKGDEPPNLGICPLSVILKKDKTRVVHDWSNPGYALNKYLENRDVDYGTMDGWLRMITKNGYMAGLDVKDCFLHWMIAPKCRRMLGVEHPVNGKKGCYLFLPFGLGPSPGWNDGCIKEMIRVMLLRRPSMKIIDFVDDMRLTDTTPSKRKVRDNTKYALRFGRETGLHFHEEGPKLIWETQTIDWLGFDVDTVMMQIRITEKKKLRGLEEAQEIIEVGEGREMSVKRLTEIVGFLNFLSTVVEGAYVHLREGWNIISECGIMMQWQQGLKADCEVTVPKRLIEDMLWWCQCLNRGPWKKINDWGKGAFVWHSRLEDLPKRIMEAPEEEVAIICTDASSLIGWGACWNEKTLQGMWNDEEKREHINWMEIVAGLKAICAWQDELAGKLVLLKMDNQVAVSYVNYGAGRCRELTRMSEKLTLLGIERSITIVAIWIAGEENTIADALSRYYMSMNWKKNEDGRSLNEKGRSKIKSIVGKIDVDMMCDADGSNSLGDRFKSEKDSAFEGEWAQGNLWWFAPRGMEGVVMKHVMKKQMRYKDTRCWLLVPEHVEKFAMECCGNFTFEGILKKGECWFVKKSVNGAVDVQPDGFDWWIIASRYADGVILSRWEAYRGVGGRTDRVEDV